MKNKLNKGKGKSKGKEAIIQLLKLHSEFKNKFPFLKRKYSDIIRNITTRLKIRLDSKEKRRICKHCYSILTPGDNCRVRLRGKNKGKNIVYYCFECKKFTKFGYGKRSEKLK